MKKYFFLLLFNVLLFSNTLFAAFITNFPVEIKQPNGEIVQLYVTGDEFSRRVHDENGYTVMKDPQTGYLVYAVLKNNELVSSGYFVGKTTPQAIGLTPGIDIPAEKKRQIRQNFLNATPEKSNLRSSSSHLRAASNTGTLNNLVIFIRFSDDLEFTLPSDFFTDWFNKDEPGASMYRYFYDISREQLSIHSTFYPIPSGTTVVSYKDILPRSAFEISNPTSSQQAGIEHALLKRAIDYINDSGMIPSDLNLDFDNDGYVDNICFIVKGTAGAWNDLLWPHQWSLYSQNVSINGKRVSTYNFQIEEHLAGFGNGRQSVLTHEMYHTLGAPDLYRYDNKAINPVGSWDVMSSNSVPPQSSTAWLTHKYGGWLDAPTEITASGTYTLNNVWSATNNCYKIKSPNSATEFFMIEYRDKSVTWDSPLPGSGLIIYRVNQNLVGNADGPPDEIYVFRPGGNNTTTNGTISSAFFSSQSGRTTFSDESSPPAFLSNNMPGLGGIVISEIGPSGGATMSFKVTFPVVTWNGDEDNDWFTTGNWVAGKVPSSTDVVTIPANPKNFPDLKTKANTPIAAEIHFEPGAQLGGQSNLSGEEKVFVRYNLSKRGSWNMLSTPLGQVFPGDFAFGGYPTTWVRTFQADEESSVAQGTWITARGGNTGAFTFGDGFAIWLNEDAADEPFKGLKVLDDTHELPYFHLFEEPPGSEARIKHDNFKNNTHEYISGIGDGIGQSTFYNYVKDDNGEYANYTVDRFDAAYRLLDESSYNKVVDFYGNFAMTGNPYMATLDFDAFNSANSGKIKDTYYVWTDKGYATYNSLTGDPGGVEIDVPLDEFIAPLQGFIVEKKAETGPSASLNFDESSMFSANPGVLLRSSSTASNKLDILARNTVAGVRTTIANREGGQDEFGDLDARKIMGAISNVPEVYTLKPYKNGMIAATVNIINNDEMLIPVGLATTYTGNITLTFSGMDSYDANLSLIDAETNRTIDLTGLATCEYVVDYAPKQVNGKTAVCEDRLFIRISKTVTGLNETIAEKVNVFESNGFIRVISGATNPIQEVSVYNLQGMLIYKATGINAATCTVDKFLPAGVYAVKVVSENGIDNVKVVK